MASLSSVALACCNALSYVLGDKVSYQGSPAYEESLTTYFNLQASTVQPHCIVFPHTADDVSVAISSLRTSTTDYLEGQHGCQFAVRSGGHGTSAGSSNIQDGVTIDLRQLNKIEVRQDHSEVSIGTGATWDEVYSSLDGLGLSVVGGRASGVGVGGLTLGGGISYLSPRYGWTCDTVLGFELVVANGSIIEAKPGKNEDLLIALRGGANNFGVITRIELKTFEQGLFWLGTLYHPTSTIDNLVQEFLSVAATERYDEYASLITTFGYSANQSQTIVANNLIYSKVNETMGTPDVFRGILNLPTLVHTENVTNMTTLSRIAGSLQADGSRRLYAEITLVATDDMLHSLYNLWNSSLVNVQRIEGIVWSINLEPLPSAIYARAAKTNSLGLSDRKGTLIVTLLSATWSRADDDLIVEDEARRLLEKTRNEARRLGAYDPFVYLNYAGHWQDPISSYGEESLQNLRRVRDTVDPEGLFTYREPGGFKIPPYRS